MSITLVAWASAAVAGGWCAGWVSAALTDRLLVADQPGATHSGLARDPLLQGSIALVWVLLVFALGPGIRWLVAAVLAVPLLQVSVTDLRYHALYTVVALVGCLAGVVLAPFLYHAPWWVGLAGGAAWAGIFGLLYGLGRLYARVRFPGQDVEPIARGDVEIAGMVGAIAGPHAVAALFLGVVLTGLVALGVLLVRRSGRVYMPYGPGLCLGGVVSLFLR